MELEQQPDLKTFLRHYLNIAQRRWKCFLPFPILAILAIYYAVSLPPVYQSEGVLLVEDQNIPEDLVRTTVTSYAAQQMEVLRQQILSTENVLQLIDAHGLYQNEDAEVDASVQPDPVRLAERFRNNMLMEAIEADIQDAAGRRRVISIAFRISFQDESPQLAQNVANELVQLFLERNLLTRQQEASETSQFLRNEADIVQKNVIELEDRIAEFKSVHADSLPELLEYNLGVIDNSELRRRENLIAIDNLTEQEQLLAIELRSIDPYTGAPIGAAGDNNPRGLTSAALLSQKKAELSQLSTKYSESHPTIRSIRREIAILEAELGSGDPDGEYALDESLLSPIYLELRYRVGSIERDIESLQEENDRLDEQILEFKQRVSDTYLVEREYEELQREFIANSERYEQLRSAQYEAEVAQSLEENNQAESLKVVERPQLPMTPVAPERPKIMLLGLGVAGALCFGLALILEFLDERIRGVRGFERIIGEAPLVSVPQIYTSEEYSSRQRAKKLALILLILIVVAVVAGLIVFGDASAV